MFLSTAFIRCAIAAALIRKLPQIDGHGFETRRYLTNTGWHTINCVRDCSNNAGQLNVNKETSTTSLTSLEYPDGIINNVNPANSIDAPQFGCRDNIIPEVIRSCSDGIEAVV